MFVKYTCARHTANWLVYLLSMSGRLEKVAASRFGFVIEPGGVENAVRSQLNSKLGQVIDS